MKNHINFPQVIQIKHLDKQNNNTYEQHENITLQTQQMKFNEQVEKWRFRIYKLSEFNLFIRISPHNENIKH